jgi:hypothetical protein
VTAKPARHRHRQRHRPGQRTEVTAAIGAITEPTGIAIGQTDNEPPPRAPQNVVGPYLQVTNLRVSFSIRHIANNHELVANVP